VGWLAFGVSALTTVIASKSYVDNADKLVDASRQQLRDAKEDLEKDKRRFSQLENSIRNNQTDYDDEVLLAQVARLSLDECDEITSSTLQASKDITFTQLIKYKHLKDGQLTAENLVNVRKELVLLKHQEQLWSHFKNELVKAIQSENPFDSVLQIMSCNLCSIVDRLVKETPASYFTNDLPAKLESFQIELLELENISSSFQPNDILDMLL